MNVFQVYYIRHVVPVAYQCHLHYFTAIHKCSPVASWDSKCPSDAHFTTLLEVVGHPGLHYFMSAVNSDILLMSNIGFFHLLVREVCAFR